MNAAALDQIITDLLTKTGSEPVSSFLSETTVRELLRAVVVELIQDPVLIRLSGPVVVAGHLTQIFFKNIKQINNKLFFYIVNHQEIRTVNSQLYYLFSNNMVTLTQLNIYFWEIMLIVAKRALS